MAKKSKKEDGSDESYYGILNELFEKDGALEKFSKVRYTYFVIHDLWQEQGISWEYLEPCYKAYFIKRFLKGRHVDNVSQEELRKALDDLAFAVGLLRDEQSRPTGCYARYLKLIEGLNHYGEKLGYKKLIKTSIFMNYYTFWPEVLKDFDGRPKVDPETGGIESEMKDRIHLLGFRRELKKAIEKGEQISVFEIARRAKAKFYPEQAKPRPEDKDDKGRKP